MLKHILTTLLLLLSIAITSGLLAQDIRLTKATDAKIDDSIDEQELAEIMQLLEATINEYAVAATLLDAEEKRVNEASNTRFNNLFSATAVVMEDFAENIPAGLLPYKDYAIRVYNILRLEGVQMDIESAELLEISRDGLGFYVPKIRVNKRMFTQITNNGEVTSSFSGVPIEQLFELDIYEDDFSSAKISKIGPYCDPCDLPSDFYNRVLSFSVGVGSAALNLTLADAYSTNFGQESFAVSSGLNYSIGAEIFTDRFITGPKNPDRRLVASLGVRLASYNINSSLNSFVINASDQFIQTAQDLNDNTNDYYRIVNAVNLEEEVSLNLLEVPLGIAYNLQKTPKMLINLHLRAIPSFALGSSANASGEGFYDGVLLIEDPDSGLPMGTPSQFRITRANEQSVASNPDLWNDENGFAPFLIGQKSIDQSTEADVKLGFALQLSPTVYWSFSDDNPAWGLLLGLDLNYHLGYWLNHNPINDLEEAAFKYPDDYPSSLTNLYLQNLSGLSYGIRIGVFNRLISEP